MRWQTVKLDDLKAEIPNAIVGGPFGSNLTTRDYVNDGVPVIRGANLSNGAMFSEHEFVFVSEEKANELAANTARKGDLVFTQRGTLGQVGLIPVTASYDRYIVSQSQMKLTVDLAKVDPRFIYFFFRHPQTVQSIKNRAITSGVPHINLGILREFPVPRPPLSVQNRIANILSAYDDLMENNSRRIRLLEDAARLLYEEWFVRFRFPGHEHIPIHNGLPDGWQRIHLSRVLSTQYGYTESATDEPVGPKFLRGTDINKTSYIDWSTVPYCPIDESVQKKYSLSVGDIVIIRMADPGKVAIVEQEVDAIFASYLIRLKPADPRIIPYYLFYFLSGNEYQGFVTGASTGATRKSASAKLVTNYHMLLPPEHLLLAFDDYIRPMRSLMTTLLTQRAKLQEARDLLLPRLMSGEVAV